MVTLSDSIPRTGSEWIDQTFEPPLQRAPLTEADRIRRDADATIDHLLGTFDVYTHAGREQAIWVLNRHREKHLHEAYVERSLFHARLDLVTAHQDAADMFDETIEELR